MSTPSAADAAAVPIARALGITRSHPTSDEFVHLARRQMRTLFLLAAVVALLVGGSLVAIPDDPIAYTMPCFVLIGIAVPILLWHFPRAMLYVTLAAVCLIELLPAGQPDSITDRIPFFWNVNTIFQTFLRANVKAVPLSLFEVLLIVAGICSMFRSVFSGQVKLRGGPVFWPIFAYLAFVFIAFANGMGTGGDFKIALQETRAQFYFLIAYLMAVNLVTTRRDVDRVLWIIAISIAIKGFLYTFRRYVTLNGMLLSDQGVGSHEEAFFFDCFVCLLASLLICGTRPKLRNFMLWTLPLVELGNLATNRRAGTAAIAILIPIVFLAAYQGFPERRRKVAIIGISLVVLGTAYYSVFKNSESAIAQPARAIKSQFQPDPRDASSNEYRDAENADQMATIRAYPLGYGYGKHFLHAVPIADISTLYEWWDIMPHNSILWIWMRTSGAGFFAFWIMISSSVINCAAVFRDEGLAIDLRALGLFGVMVIGCQLIFGLLDLQMVNPRDVMFTAFAIGLACRVQSIEANILKNSNKSARRVKGLEV